MAFLLQFRSWRVHRDGLNLSGSLEGGLVCIQGGFLGGCRDYSLAEVSEHVLLSASVNRSLLSLLTLSFISLDLPLSFPSSLSSPFSGSRL